MSRFVVGWFVVGWFVVGWFVVGGFVLVAGGAGGVSDLGSGSAAGY
jgi:hypothetical protein